jgi:hypothetical protein
LGQKSTLIDLIGRGLNTNPNNEPLADSPTIKKMYFPRLSSLFRENSYDKVYDELCMERRPGSDMAKG